MDAGAADSGMKLGPAPPTQAEDGTPRGVVSEGEEKLLQQSSKLASDRLRALKTAWFVAGGPAYGEPWFSTNGDKLRLVKHFYQGLAACKERRLELPEGFAKALFEDFDFDELLKRFGFDYEDVRMRWQRAAAAERFRPKSEASGAAPAAASDQSPAVPVSRRLALDRLRALKAAWFEAGGPVHGQLWFNECGSKSMLVEGLERGFEACAHRRLELPDGFKEAVTAEDFDFDAVMKRFGYDYAQVLKKRRKASGRIGALMRKDVLGIDVGGSAHVPIAPIPSEATKDASQTPSEVDHSAEVTEELQTASRLMQRGEHEAGKLATMVDQVEKLAEQAEAEQSRQVAMIEESLGRARTKRNGLEATLQDKVSAVGEARGRLAHATNAAKMLKVGVAVPIEGTAELSQGAGALGDASVDLSGEHGDQARTCRFCTPGVEADRIAKLEEENRRLRDRVAELEALLVGRDPDSHALAETEAQEAFAGEPAVEKSAAEVMHIDAACVAAVDAESGAETPPQVGALPQDAPAHVLGAHAGLLEQPTALALDRLRLVRSAWFTAWLSAGKGEDAYAGQRWLGKQWGRKADRLAAVMAGLAALETHDALQDGFRDAVLAPDFELNCCLRRFHLEHPPRHLGNVAGAGVGDDEDEFDLTEQDASAGEAVVEKSAAEVVHIDTAGVDAVDAESGAEIPPQVGASPKDAAAHVLGAHVGLLEQSSTLALDRLKVVRSAWFSAWHAAGKGEGPFAGQPWLARWGRKIDRLAAVMHGLSALETHYTLDDGFREAVLAPDFELECCLRRFRLEHPCRHLRSFSGAGIADDEDDLDLTREVDGRSSSGSAVCKIRRLKVMELSNDDIQEGAAADRRQWPIVFHPEATPAGDAPRACPASASNASTPPAVVCVETPAGAVREIEAAPPPEKSAGSPPDARRYLLEQPISTAVDRLSAVKCAWHSAGGEAGEAWSTCKGSRADIVGRIFWGLTVLEARRALRPGFRAMVLAHNFNLVDCLRHFGLQGTPWRIPEACETAESPASGPRELLGQTTESAANRLRAVKCAWLAAGGERSQAWFASNGLKRERLLNIWEGLAALEARQAMPPGFRETVLARNFNLQRCLKKYRLNLATLRAGGVVVAQGADTPAAASPVDSRNESVSAEGAADVVDIDVEVDSINDAVSAEEAADAVDIDVEADEDSPLTLHVSTALAGATHIRLSQVRRKCPPALLPSGAKILPPAEPSDPFAPTPSAEVSGVSLPAPAHLGEIPEGLPLPAAPGDALPWHTMLLVGPSGSGKTSFLKSLRTRLCSEGVDVPLYPTARWEPGVSVIEQFATGFEEAQYWFCAVGLSSVPTWTKPFAALSLGEQYRANVARTLAAGTATGASPLIFDEWTSELDRGVARSVCVALQKRLAARRAEGRRDPPMFFATCHEDIAEHLAPDVIVRFVEGQPPALERCLAAGAEAARPAHRGSFLGEAEPLPPGGTLVGNWRVLSPAGEARSLTINYYMKSWVALAIDTAGLRKFVRLYKDAACGASTALADARTMGVWYYAYNDAEGLDMKVRREAVDSIVFHVVERPRCIVSLEHRLKMARHVRAKSLPALLGTGKSVKDRGYDTKFNVHLPLIKKVRRVGKEERAAFARMPSQRSDEDRALLETFVAALNDEVLKLEGQFHSWAADETRWGPEFVGSRVARLSSNVADWMSERSLHHYSSREAVGHLQAAGWYVPREVLETNMYPGLVATEIVSCAPEFRFDGKETPEASVHLASFVGEGDGYLSPALEQAARYLDNGFDGLCVHPVPALPQAKQDVMRGFRLAVLTGPSGTGKTTAARQHFGEVFRVEWTTSAPALSHFRGLQEAEAALAAAQLPIGIAARPVELLSGGERERASLALALAEWASGRRTTLIIDEFTSLVDRLLALRVARGLMNFVLERPSLRGLVVLTAQTDVIGRHALQPDVLYETHLNRWLFFQPAEGIEEAADEPQPKRLRLTRPPTFRPSQLHLKVRRALQTEWRYFRDEHYKDHSLHTAAVCFVGELGDVPVAFSAAICTGIYWDWWSARACLGADLGYDMWSPRPVYREHRTVVRPDYQGLGLGSLMSDVVADLYLRTGLVFASTTAHPTFGGYRNRSPFWMELPTSRRERPGNACPAYSHIWIGACRPDGSLDESLERLLRERVPLGPQASEQAVVSAT